MKKLLLIVLITVSNIINSQTVGPKEYSKIKFVYEQKSNFLLENDKVYADTLLFKYEYPQLKFSKTVSPLDSTKIIGFIEFKNFHNEDRKKLQSTLYHSTHIIEGTYDVKKNRTNLHFKRGGEGINEIFKKYFGEGFSNFRFDIVIDYNSRQIKTNYPSQNYTESLDSKLRKINFINNDNSIGTYTFQTKSRNYTNMVTLNKEYNNKITPEEVFSNNGFGISEIVSLHDTTKLLSVIYEK